MFNRPKSLKLHIEAGRADQNGFGYDEFARIASLPTRPSYRSVALIFNRNERTIKAWFKRYDEEVSDGL